MRNKRIWVAVAFTANLLLLPLVLAAPTVARARPVRAGRRSGPGGHRLAGDRDQIPESGRTPAGDPLDRLRRSGLI